MDAAELRQVWCRRSKYRNHGEVYADFSGQRPVPEGKENAKCFGRAPSERLSEKLWGLG